MKADKVLDKLSRMTYGWYDHNNDKNITPDSKEFFILGYFEQNCHVLRSNELLKRKIGTCWDFSLYAYEELSKTYSDVLFSYFEFMTNKKQLVTHTTVLFKDDNNLWKWFESAWGKLYGINGPYPIQSIHNNIVEIIKEQYNVTKLKYAVHDCDISKLLSTTTPITAEMFINTMRNTHTSKR